jgi:hypothetical protein
VAIDTNTNLLLDLFPHPVGGEGLARAFELLQILQQHFQSARSDEGSREVMFPNSHTPAMRAVFNRDGRLVGLHAMPGLTEAALAALRERVRLELVDSTGGGIGREVFFSLAPVQGWWRHHDCFQLLPVPPHAPRPKFSYAHHPFLLEFPYDRARDPFMDYARRDREAWPIHLVLNALLTTPVWWTGRRAVGTHDYSWVLLPSTTDRPESNVAYLQHSYSYNGYVATSEAFSPVDGIRPIAAIPAAEYYGDPYPATGDPLVIPDNLGQSFDLFFQASPRRRQQFLRACYWLSQVSQLTSFSLSFICAVQAIDALLPPVSSGGRCKECGQEQRPSRTALFVEFLNRFAPSPTVTDADRRTLFKVRSHLSHGFRDPLIVDQAAGVALHPEDCAERTQGTRALQTARIALYNWLHTQEPTA